MEEDDSIDAAVAAFVREIVAYTTADRAHRGYLLGSVASATDLPDVRRFLP
jgi:hypothetical protein